VKRAEKKIPNLKTQIPKKSQTDKFQRETAF